MNINNMLFRIQKKKGRNTPQIIFINIIAYPQFVHNIYKHLTKLLKSHPFQSFDAKEVL